MIFSLVELTKSVAKVLRKNSPLLNEVSHTETLDLFAKSIGFRSYRELNKEWEKLTYEKLSTDGVPYHRILSKSYHKIASTFKLSEENVDDLLHPIFSCSRLACEWNFLTSNYCPIDTAMGLGNLDIPFGNNYCFPGIIRINMRKRPQIGVYAKGLDKKIYASVNYYQTFGVDCSKRQYEKLIEVMEYMHERDSTALIRIPYLDLTQDTIKAIKEDIMFGDYIPERGGDTAPAFVWNYTEGTVVPFV